MYPFVEIISVPKKLEFYLYNRMVYSLIKKGYKVKALNYFFKILSNGIEEKQMRDQCQ